MATAPRCPECKGSMEEGYLVDRGHNEVTQVRWHPGAPETRRLFGLNVGLKVSRDRMIPVETWRCRSCGLLRSYARAAAGKR